MSAPVATIGEALVAKLQGGTFNAAPIRVALATGGEVRPPSVLIASPSIGFHALGEGWVLDRTEWRLQLYSNDGREPNVAVELAFLEAVLDALEGDVTLGGLVAGLHPLGMDEAVAEGAGVDSEGRPTPPTMFRRELRIEIHH